jgi:flagellar motility protein MotE (MotC chaperone)
VKRALLLMGLLALTAGTVLLVPELPAVSTARGQDTTEAVDGSGVAELPVKLDAITTTPELVVEPSPLEGAETVPPPPIAPGTPEGALADRLAALEAARASLLRQEERLAEREDRLTLLWEQARDWRASCETACGQSVTTTSLWRPEVLTIEEQASRMAHLVTIMKKMKPKDAAAIVASWDDGLAVEVLGTLSPRHAAPIVSKMTPNHAGRLTSRLGTGHSVVRLPRPEVAR